MATGWVKAMQCRSIALGDVCQQQQPALPKKDRAGGHHLPLACGTDASVHHLPLGCGLDASVHHCSPKKTSSRGSHHHPATITFSVKPNPQPRSRRPPPKPKPKPKPASSAPAAAPPTLAPSPARRIARGPFPTLASLPPGHSSRQVVETIFSSAWCPPAPFPGHVEMLFRVNVPPRAASRFEEYRDTVRRRAGDADPRCAADGNEVMRFHAAPASSSSKSEGKEEMRQNQPIFSASPRPSAPGGGIRTFQSSGAAHRIGGGKERGRAAMLLCRVIAGRVRSESNHRGKGASLLGLPSGGSCESVAGGKGELVVYDRRAVLPCFLIIYKL